MSRFKGFCPEAREPRDRALAGSGVESLIRNPTELAADLADDQVAALCLLNVASIAVFLEHVGVVEGYPDRDTALAAFERGDSRVENMPAWVNSIWLPFDFEPAGTLAEEPTLFIGSCPGLLRELTYLQRRSPLGLGVASSGYERMRQDITAFYRDPTPFQLDEADTVRWIWRALFDATGIAMKSTTALWAG